MLNAARPLLHPARRFKGYNQSQQRRDAGRAMTMGFAEACQIVGVESSPGLTMKEVRTSYARLANRYHPDKSGSNATTEKWHQLQQALRILKEALAQNQGFRLPGAQAAQNAKLQKAKAKNAWANATFTMHRVWKWRAGARGQRPGMLGAQVQNKMLDDIPMPEEEDHERYNTRSR